MQEKVNEFNAAVGMLNRDRELSYKLLLEEFNEYKEADNMVDKCDAICDIIYVAYGCCKKVLDRDWTTIYCEKTTLMAILGAIKKLRKQHNDIPRIASFIISHVKHLAKLNNITPETLESMFNEVHRSNMSKINSDGSVTKNEHGKVMKPATYFKPNLKQFL